jgi:hypothetical protein
MTSIGYVSVYETNLVGASTAARALREKLSEVDKQGEEAEVKVHGLRLLAQESRHVLHILTL